MTARPRCDGCRYWTSVVSDHDGAPAIGHCAQIVFGPLPGAGADRVAEEWPQVFTLAEARCPAHAPLTTQGGVA